MCRNRRVNELVTRLHQNNYIDDMTKKWFSQTRNPPRIHIYYTLTKIHKPNPVGRPIISGCEGPTERLSSFVDKILQPIAQTQKSYLKDTTHFINFIEKTKVSQNTILVSTGYGCNKLVYKHTARGGYYNGMQSIRKISQLQPSHPIPLSQRNALPYP